ncbi:hypothetical protein COR50_09160 [Chitinophaga caeni]|uniref:HMA domain-containing protein n=1 Tax=Chitinophaga caeni TaxID=2029983 RepID=A0A291QTR7_9BACT|nr:hypothetical protein [Chitinophaga caeni]ATL47327.1 hypothetical protein COR50_09160 [Chitinophaga caeni]
MIGIFKTNIATPEAKSTVLDAIQNSFEITACNVDIEDCDRVLRIVDLKVPESTVIHFVRDIGYDCDVLE